MRRGLTFPPGLRDGKKQGGGLPTEGQEGHEKGLITIAKGKYQEWLTPDGLTMLEGLARDGLTDEQISQKMGIGVSTLYRWEQDYQEIRDALKRGKAPVDIQVENALLKRALGYEYDEVVEEVEHIPIGKPDEDGNQRIIDHVKKKTKRVTVLPDVTAQIFWLKNRRPDKWRDKVEQVQTVGNELLESLMNLERRSGHD